MANPENLKGHEFKPGQSGNLAGRPPGAISLSTALKLMLQEEIEVDIEGEGKAKKLLRDVMLRKLIKIAIKGDKDEAIIKAIKEIFDRVDGKAQQFIEMQIPGGIESLTKHEVIFKDFSKPRKKSKPKPQKNGNKSKDQQQAD